MKAGCQTRRGRTHGGARTRYLAGCGSRWNQSERRASRARITRTNRARKSCEDVMFLMPAAGAAAARRTSGRSAGLVALPLFDRFAAEPPVAADAEAGQASLSEQTVDRRRMNPQVFRQFLDGENLIALSCLSHTLGGLAWKRRFLRRSFFHSTAVGVDFTLQLPASVVAFAESRCFVRTDRWKLRATACESVRRHRRNDIYATFKAL